MRSENHVRAMHEFINFPVSIKCLSMLTFSNIFAYVLYLHVPTAYTSNSFLLLMFLESESPDYLPKPEFDNFLSFSPHIL